MDQWSVLYLAGILSKLGERDAQHNVVANDRLRSIDREGPRMDVWREIRKSITGAAMGTHSRAGVEKRLGGRIPEDEPTEIGACSTTFVSSRMMKAKGSARRQYGAQNEGGD